MSYSSQLVTDGSASYATNRCANERPAIRVAYCRIDSPQPGSDHGAARLFIVPVECLSVKRAREKDRSNYDRYPGEANHNPCAPVRVTIPMAV